MILRLLLVLLFSLPSLAQVIAHDVIPDTTGRTLGAESQRWNLKAQIVDMRECRMNGQPCGPIGSPGPTGPPGPVGTGLEKNASAYAGATPEDKIVTAAADTASRGTVAPSTMTGTFSATRPLRSLEPVRDLRGYCFINPYALECSGAAGASGGWELLRMRVAEAIRAPNADNYGRMWIHVDAERGGVNSYVGGVYHKSNVGTLGVSQLSYTPGQHMILQATAFNGSHGDTTAGAFLANQWGNTNLPNGGDEGLSALDAYAYQGQGEQFTATVAHVGSGASINADEASNGNTLTYTSASAEYSRGELRYATRTNRGVYATGTASGISGTTITGSGTSWASLCPGGTAPCTVSNLFFDLDGGNAAHASRYVTRVKTVDSNTQLTLTWDTQDGVEQSWQGDATSGTYKIYHGGTITRVYKSGAVDVDNPSEFQAGDTLLSPIGNYLGLRAFHAQCAKYIPGGWNSGCASVSNIGPRSLYGGIMLSGKFDNYLSMLPQDGGKAIVMQGDTRDVLTNWSTPDDAAVTLWRLNRNAAPIYGSAPGDFTITLTKQYDELGFSNAYYGFWGTSNNGTLNVGSADHVPYFGIRPSYTLLNNGSDLLGFSDNQVTQTWRIYGATGAASLGATTATSLTIAGCAAGTYAKADGSGCSVPTITEPCSVGLWNGGAAITAGSYSLTGRCLNVHGVTATITAIKCYSDNNGTSTGNVANSAGTALLTGAITASNAFASGTQSATTTLAANAWTNWTLVADGTSTTINCVMVEAR